MIRLVAMVGLAGLAVAGAGLSAGAEEPSRESCDHGERVESCGFGNYPEAQTTHPGWCESHFVVDPGSGFRYHRCPLPWTVGQTAPAGSGTQPK